MNIVLFGLTGFGNSVLMALLNERKVQISAVFTTKYEKPFPYYEEKQLIDLCKENNIRYHVNKLDSEEGISTLRALAPDLILVATFRQIIQSNVISIPRLGIVNIHPSLLPKYRGPNPTNNALLHGESITGITMHYLTERLDAGNVLLQKAINIEDDDTDGNLRKKLSSVASSMIPNLIELFQQPRIPVGIPQDEGLSTYATKPRAEDGYLEVLRDIESFKRRIRGLTPYPGTSFLIEHRRVPIDKYHGLSRQGRDGVYEADRWIDIFINSKGLRLIKKDQ